jgi:hypothetical protein
MEESTMGEENQTNDEIKSILLELDIFKNYKDYNRDYEEKIVNLIRQLKNVDNIEEKFEMLLKEVINDNTYNDDVAYVVFFTLCTIYRRKRHFSKYHLLVTNEKYIRQFEKYISFCHLKSMCLIEVAKTRNEILEAVECSKSVIEKAEDLISKEEAFKLNIGFYHSYALNVAKGFEDSFLTRPRDDEYFKLAKDYANKSIKYNKKYAKFHCTLGRLYLIEKQYKEAIEECLVAIDNEDPVTTDDFARINDYQNYILTAKSFLNLEELNDKLFSEIKNKVDDIKSKNIEVLIFFVSIMSFVIGSIQLANSEIVFIDKAALIILLFGCLLSVLGVFGRSLNESNKQSYFFSVIFGVIMIVSSFIIHFNF